jgi:hypothetical protein
MWGVIAMRYRAVGLLLTSHSPTCFLFSLSFRILKRKNEFSVKHYLIILGPFPS